MALKLAICCLWIIHLTKVCLMNHLMSFAYRDDNYLFNIVFFYLESFHCSRYSVHTFVKGKFFLSY
jgi:hypothetical protein